MKKISKYRIDKVLLVALLLMVTISIISISSAETLIGGKDLALKQGIWYIVGIGVVFFVMFIGNNFIIKNAWVLYIIGNLTLVALLIFAEPISDAKCWFQIPGIGTVQPSEFMKIILIIVLGRVIKEFNDAYSNPSVKEEFFFLLKVAGIVAIPSILTFLQPDTGVVLIYLLITVIMLFIAGIRYRWFAILFLTIFGTLGVVLGIYFINNNLFIKIFGSSLFLRIDRLLDWSNKSGFQLENGLTAIGSGGLWGHGFNNTPIYFPEAQTDFIFAVYASNFGLVGSILLLLVIAFFDIKLILIALKSNSNIDKYIIAGIVGMLIYQQLQNIGMTVGLMPITGITLPFISYGGSSLLSYMIMVGIIFNISNDNIRNLN